MYYVKVVLILGLFFAWMYGVNARLDQLTDAFTDAAIRIHKEAHR